MGRFRYAVVLAFVTGLVTTATVPAMDYRYAISIYGGDAMLTSGNFFSFKNAPLLGGGLRYYPGGRWYLDFEYSRFTSKNDESKTLTDSIESVYNNSPLRFKASRMGVSLGRYLFDMQSRLNLSLSADAALVVWRINDPAGDTTVHVRGAHNENTTLAASELSAGGSFGVTAKLSQSVWLTALVRGQYLTGAGAEFGQAAQTARDRWIVTVRAGLQVHFGHAAAAPWPSDSAWRMTQPSPKPRSKGAPSADPAFFTDSDRDGVVDAYDDCPGTPREAVGYVDIQGCPIDSDRDGVPDYLDHCPDSPAGAKVDANGCPIDSDGDGVPDGIDDCPDSPIAVPVDRFGCIDLSMFSKPMVLNVDYLPGSFEIDVSTRERLRKVAGILLLVPEVKLEIIGYTDNIGLPDANQKLSEKRARRVRDYLVAMGVAADRMKASGRGEENQIASNDTAEDRSKNRRIEIVFYR